MRACLRLLATTGVVALIGGCGSSAPVEKTVPTVAYIDARTREVVRLPQQPGSPTNPANGNKLSPALYCPKCAKWYPAPPFEVLQRTPSAFECRKCKTRMEVKGPE